MALQRVIMAKIAGSAGNRVVRTVGRWQSESQVSNGGRPGRNVLAGGARVELDSFVEEVSAHRYELPVVFFVEYVDAWSMWDLVERYVDGAGRVCKASSPTYEIACYSLPDGGKLASVLTRALSHRSVEARAPQEDRWFVGNALEAVYAWGTVAEQAALLCIREIRGPSWLDDQVRASLQTVPEWVPGPM